MLPTCLEYATSDTYELFMCQELNEPCCYKQFPNIDAGRKQSIATLSASNHICVVPTKNQKLLLVDVCRGQESRSG